MFFKRESEKTYGGVKAVDKRMAILISATAVCVVCFLLAVILLILNSIVSTAAFANEHKSETLVGYYAEYLGTVRRNVPKTASNEGLETGYPQYGYTMNLNAAQKSAMIRESAYLATSDTSANSGTSVAPYNMMDKDGKLYYCSQKTDASGQKYFSTEPSVGADGKQRVLYKHTAAAGMYLGDVSDREPGIIKKITLRPRAYTSYYDVTGIYAPAGEVIKIEISEEDMNATNGISIHIGQALYNGQANNIWSERNVNRMPVILNTFNINKNTATLENGVYTAYVGSFLGGPVYVRDERAIFSVTISGGVNYPHYILGYTTKAEFESNKKSSAPYFDLEVWENGVLHSGPRKYADSFSYDEIYDAAVLWDKISLVSTQRATQGIVFLYDPFVAAGAAVAFPGRRSVNCPMGWMASSLNYKQFVTSGAWGNMHEYNHNFQGFGCLGSDGEITNNSLNLVEYSLFTKISRARSLNNYGGSGLSGWNQYTSATWATHSFLSGNVGGTSGLAVYSTLLHNFGQDAFMKSSYGHGEAYFTNWGNVTHHNMSYFTRYLSQYVDGISYSDALNEKQKDYPVFVPVSSVYQTGRSYDFDGQKRYIETQQPYVIAYGEDFTIDLRKYNAPGGQYESGSVVLPENFDYTITNITTPDHGTISKTDDKVYKFIPDENIRSGKIYVTLKITPPAEAGFTADDVEEVELVLEFEQTHEFSKSMLQRTTYTYAEGKAYTDAEEAFNAGYIGFETANSGNNVNPTQNSNTDVWYTFDEPAPENSVVEVRGKLYVEETAKYRIALRGRWNCALFVSMDEGKTYELAGKITAAKDANFRPEDPLTYTDFEELHAGTWVYFKAVMVCHSVPHSKGKLSSFVGVGWAKFIPPGGVYNEAGELVGETPETVNVTYASAYRESYQFNNEKFTTEYFYKRDYTFSLNSEIIVNSSGTVIDSVYQPWDNTEKHKLDNLFDGNDDTFIHTSAANVSAENPFMVCVELGESTEANRIVFVGSAVSGNYKTYLPKTFKVELSTDGVNWTVAADVASSTVSGLTVAADFGETFAFRYYKITVTDTHSTARFKYLALNKIEFETALLLPNGKVSSIDSAATTVRGDWVIASANSFFGHVYKAGRGAVLELNFTGERLALLSTDLTASQFEVFIDGVKVNSLETRGVADGFMEVSYVSPKLENGEHRVSIRCYGEANFDSVVSW